MKESKEKFPIEPQEKVPIELKYTPEDYETVGRDFVRQKEPFLARAYLRHANLSPKEIDKILTEAPKKQSSEKKQMEPEEKKKLFEKMIEDFEKDFERTGKEEYKDLAKAYRKELEEMEKKQKE